jgi:hypothetical protein
MTTAKWTINTGTAGFGLERTSNHQCTEAVQVVFGDEPNTSSPAQGFFSLFFAPKFFPPN